MSNDTHTGTVVTRDKNVDPTNGSSTVRRTPGEVTVKKLEGIWGISASINGTKVANYSKFANAWIPTEEQVTFLSNREFVNDNATTFSQGAAYIINGLNISDKNDIVNTAFSSGVSLGPTIGQNPAAGSNPGGEGNEVAIQTASPTEPQATDDEPLRYPLLNADSVNYDYLRIQNFEYAPALGLSSGGLDRLSAQSVEDRITVSKGVVYLPMHPGISESNSVGWNEDSANAIQTVLGSAAINAIDNLSNFQAGKASKEFIESIVNGLQSGAGDPSLIPYITAYFAQQQLGTNLTGRSTGQVLNPNLELLFNGPKLRT